MFNFQYHPPPLPSTPIRPTPNYLSFVFTDDARFASMNFFPLLMFPEKGAEGQRAAGSLAAQLKIHWV